MSFKNVLKTLLFVSIFLFAGSSVFASNTIILRPNSSGDECNLPSELNCSACPDHYTCVDEVDDTEYVLATTTPALRDFYNFQNTSQLGVIEKIETFTRYNGVGTGTFRTYIKTHGVEYFLWSSDYSGTWKWTTHTLTLNPNTNNPWTWDEVNDLQIGIYMSSYGTEARCSEIYFKIYYEGTYLTIPTSFTTSTLAYAGQLFTDLSLVIVLVIGLPVGFWVIKKVISLIKVK